MHKNDFEARAEALRLTDKSIKILEKMDEKERDGHVQKKFRSMSRRFRRDPAHKALFDTSDAMTVDAHKGRPLTKNRYRKLKRQGILS